MASHSKTDSATRILLVDNRQKRAIMLSTHGYDVESTSNLNEAYLFWRAEHPDLVLLALSKDSDRELRLWERIKRADPEQPVAFLIKDALYRPVSCIADVIGKRKTRNSKEHMKGVIDKVAAVFAA